MKSKLRNLIHLDLAEMPTFPISEGPRLPIFKNIFVHFDTQIWLPISGKFVPLKLHVISKAPYLLFESSLFATFARC